MGTDPIIGNEKLRDALVRLSEALSASSEPETFAKSLAETLEEFVQFDSLGLLVVKGNSNETEWHVLGKGPLLVRDFPIEKLPTWHVFNTQEPLHISDWNSDSRFPHLKQVVEELGLSIGSVVCLPLTMPHRRLGALGIASRFVANYRPEDIAFLQLIAPVVALAIDDGLNLRCAHSAHERLQNQNDRLQLLLNLTQRVTSNLELREVLRAIAANIREVIQCDAVAVSLPDLAAGKSRLYALDFPGSKGFIAEELIVPISPTMKRALESLSPVIANMDEDISLEVRDKVRAEGLKGICLIPLVNHDRTVGVLSIMRTTEAPFAAEDIEFLMQASGQIAIAIENAVAYRKISDLKDKLAQEKLYLQEEIRSEMGFEQIIGSSLALRHVLAT